MKSKSESEKVKVTAKKGKMKLKRGGLSGGAAWLEVYPRLMPVKMITKLKCEIESENKEK